MWQENMDSQNCIAPLQDATSLLPVDPMPSKGISKAKGTKPDTVVSTTEDVNHEGPPSHFTTGYLLFWVPSILVLDCYGNILNESTPNNGESWRGRTLMKQTRKFQDASITTGSHSHTPKAHLARTYVPRPSSAIRSPRMPSHRALILLITFVLF